MSLLQINNLKKIYTGKFKSNQCVALDEVSFSVEEGEYVAIMGESGSGKTTLLNILASLDKPTYGEVLLNQKDITKIKDKDLAKFRRDHLGFVFQDFNLLDTFSVKDNIVLPLVLSRQPIKKIENGVVEIAKELKIDNLLEKYPYELSGGQKQRVAVARALITRPDIVLADEPTGALDSKSSANLLEIFRRINQKGQTILMVTHSSRAASHASRVLFIKDGKVFHQLYKGDQTNDQFYETINATLTIISNRGE